MKCVMEVVTKMKCTIKVATEVEGANEMKSVMELPTEWICDESKTQKKSLLKIENESMHEGGNSSENCNGGLFSCFCQTLNTNESALCAIQR